MSNKIKQLAEQAGVGRLVHVGGGEWDTFLPPELVVFADLIIQECIKSCNENQLHGTLMAETRIKQHFGIK